MTGSGSAGMIPLLAVIKAEGLMAKSDGKSKIAAGIWERVMRFEQAPSATTARALLKLQFPERDQQRMSDLAMKARAGTLTPAEDQEAETYEQIGCVLDILHSQARRTLNRPRKAS
ncbi:MAG: hypothetical protein ACREHD_28660 [Pirellulales bacterium]